MVSQLVAERCTAAVKAAPHGRCVDPEHPPRLLGSQTEPLDQDQRISLAARELRAAPFGRPGSQPLVR